MSEEDGIRNQKTYPESREWNPWWRRALPHNDSPQASSDQKNPEVPQPATSGEDGGRSGEPGGNQ